MTTTYRKISEQSESTARKGFMATGLAGDNNNKKFDLGDITEYGEVATPTTNPGTPDGKCVYPASEVGVYTYFPDSNGDPIEITEEGSYNLVWNLSSWSLQIAYISSKYPFKNTSSISNGAISNIKISSESSLLNSSGIRKVLYIALIRNIDGNLGAFIRVKEYIEDGTDITISQFYETNSGVRTGKEVITLTGDIEVECEVDWDKIAGDIILSFNEGELATSILDDWSALNSFSIANAEVSSDKSAIQSAASIAFSRGLSRYIDTASVFDSSFPYQAILDIELITLEGYSLNDKKYYLAYARNRVADGIMFQIKEYVDGISDIVVCQIYDPTPTTGKITGKQRLLIPELDNSGLNCYLTCNFDLFDEIIYIITGSLVINNKYVESNTRLNYIQTVDSGEDGQINYQNVFGDVLPTAFKKKMFNLDDDINVLLLGNSLIGLMESTTENETPEYLPPGCNYRHITYRLYDKICTNKPIADRWDSDRVVFTEVGAFVESDVSKFNTPEWSGEASAKTSINKESNTANASITFDFNTDDFEKFNFIGRKSIDGTPSATVSINRGNAILEVYDIASEVWIEANGYVINQHIDSSVAVEGSGYSQHVRTIRTKFRRVSGISGGVTITVSKGVSTSEYLYYWGIEKWNSTTIFFTNIGRGGKPVVTMQKNFLNDVIERKPDFVMFEAPLANETYFELNALKAYYNTFLFNTDVAAQSLKSESNDFADFQILVIIPHGRSSYYNGDQAIYYQGTSQWEDANQLAHDNYRRIRQYINDNKTEGIECVDLGMAMLEEAKAIGMTYEESLVGTSATSKESFTQDGIHTNNFGTIKWAKFLCPLFY